MSIVAALSGGFTGGIRDRVPNQGRLPQLLDLLILATDDTIRRCTRELVPGPLCHNYITGTRPLVPVCFLSKPRHDGKRRLVRVRVRVRVFGRSLVAAEDNETRWRLGSLKMFGYF